MNRDQAYYLLLSPFILAAHCLAAVGETVKGWPKEMAEALEFLGNDEEIDETKLP